MTVHRGDDDELARIGVLQELTTAAIQLFEPEYPVSDFLDRIAVRFGTPVVLCLSARAGQSARWLGDVGLSAASRRLPLPALDPALSHEDWWRTLPFPELSSRCATCWGFKLPQRGDEGVFLLLFFSEAPPSLRYQSVIRKLCGVLSTALHHRHILEQSQAREQRIAEQAALLQASNSEILAANTALEQRVAERTQALTEANAELSASLVSLKDTQEQLLRAGKLAAIGTLMAGIAHEINNPLSYVISNLDLALESLLSSATEDPPTDLREMVGDALNGAERVQIIVKSLRKFSNMNSDLSVPVDMARMLRGVERMARLEVGRRARFSLSLENPLPNVLGDETQLSQVFINLLINAAQAIPEGHAEENVVWLSARTAEGRVAVEVGDTGSGIPESLISKIFDPFFTTKPVGEGTGLGLSICHRIIDAHGGEIRVKSATGEGTTFSVLLPATAQTQSKPHSSAPPLIPCRGRVLVVDDDLNVGNMMQRILFAEHNVTVCSSAQSGLALLETGQIYDVILCDIMMPGMNGMDFYTLVEERFPQMLEHIIFVTGDSQAPSTAGFLGKVRNQKIEKPFKPKDIKKVVAEQLSRGSRPG